MSQTPRLLLIAPSAMTRTPAFDRAAALALVMQLPLHIVAFDYLQALAVAGLFAHEQMSLAQDGYLQTHRQWLAEQAALLSQHGVEVTSEVVWVRGPDRISHIPASGRSQLSISHDTMRRRSFHASWLMPRPCLSKR